MTYLIWILLVAWLLLGALAYGITFAYFQRKWPRLAAEDRGSDRVIATLLGLLGPIGLFVALVSSGGARYGVKF